VTAPDVTAPDAPAPRLIVVGGGARSGKSRFALARALALGERRVFLATAEALDDEMRDRIARHAAERGDSFRTVEAPRQLADAIAIVGATTDVDVILVDCLTLWLSNLLVDGLDEAAIAARIAELALALRGRRCHVIVVSNEVGLGIVPMAPLARAFRDATGRAHQALAAIADELYLAAMGVVLRLRPDPVAVVDHALALDQRVEPGA
jgi:adenosylcobinamide kinase/adenosylcobinamide-phosphate guanylyltransferase